LAAFHLELLQAILLIHLTLFIPTYYLIHIE
jgi:hypothetical protein